MLEGLRVGHTGEKAAEVTKDMTLAYYDESLPHVLGTPMISDSFHRDRWDYAYYYRRGRSPDADRRWIVVYFENDRVQRIDRDLELQPES